MSMLISIVIPCANDKTNIENLLRDINSQKNSFSAEIIRIDNISPAGKARNTGAKQAKGDILVFIDCDIRLGSNYVLNNLVDTLINNEDIGMACASIRIPPGSSRFQIRYSKEIPHCESPIVDELTDVAVATSACCAIFKDVFIKLDGFKEKIPRGEDPELSYRLRKAGYRNVLAPKTWGYHSPPKNMRQLIMVNIRDGLAVAFADIVYPDLNIDVNPKGIIYFPGKKTMLLRAKRFFNLFFGAVLKFNLLFLLSRFVYLIGFFCGYFKYRVLKLIS